MAINGFLAGYFAGQRELRQRDPLSLYLFVIAMEVFLNLLDIAAAEGRVQLINSIVFSMASYWCSHFILPKTVIKLVQQKCRSFLCKGLEQHSGGGKVSWETDAAHMGSNAPTIDHEIKRPHTMSARDPSATWGLISSHCFDPSSI
ncbi:hypothetical protein CRG98_022690 [Punica granatum]|uniref:Uncharacterized protein n=1 Tax=Punica granatum TaxID=22663 RepID=A0A2I0JL15_PUNGR|nr:hypothetical protein CRG98_022690 [Punica granatum]